MTSIENYFSTHKLIFILFSVITLPIVLLWSLIYGVVIGIIGITVDRYETLKKIVRRQAIESLKYPRWNAKKYREIYLGAIDDPRMRVEAAEAFKRNKVRPPATVWQIITDVFIFGLVFYPFLLVWGILTGPVRAFLEYWKWCYKVWFGYSIYEGGLKNG
jgi:hypothetical protein